ncbi:MAG: class I SAM-dependent methyltransferase [Anaerolineales bacterium]
MKAIVNEFHDQNWWQQESLKYNQPHYRLVKCARIVNALAGDKECDLLDIGCGPAILSQLVEKNIHYYGIDLVIHDPSPNLLEIDLAMNEINFQEKSFDLIVAQGFFEYIGKLQSKKFSEIKRNLKKNGKFIVTYVNFSHLHKQIYPIYNNIMPLNNFIKDLSSVFRIERFFPSSHNWIGTEPRKAWLKKIQMRLYIEIPFISPLFGVEYFFICS